MLKKSPRKLPEIVRRNIRTLRSEAGITQQELANRAGFHVAFISKIESKAHNITLFVLERVANGLGYPVERLITFRETVSAPKNKMIKLDQAIRLLKEFRQRVY